MKGFLLTIALITTSIVLDAQPNINLNATTNGTTVNVCNANFFDSGGSGGNYANNESYTITFCPTIANSAIRILFPLTSLNLGNGDMITIYDGNNTSASILATADNTANQSIFVEGSVGGGGCITIEFISDGTSVGIGWFAETSCVPICQTVIPILTSTTPAVKPATGTIDICPGETVDFAAQGSYPQNNIAYAQSDVTSTFEWVIEGQNYTGQIVQHTFLNPGGFIAKLTITDANGCSNLNALEQEIRVSNIPNFDNMILPSSPNCIGDTLNFIGTVQQTPANFAVPVTTGDSIFLPDGNGVSYSTSINITDFATGQFISSINDLEALCINFEHSYMGDLDIEIECPNGQIVQLHNQAGGGTYLGIPVDNDATPLIPGQGFDYCWEMNAPNPSWAASSGGGIGTLPAGSYTPIQSFNLLNGCPLNGTWTLTFTDNIGSDNGFLFGWGLDFADALYPNLDPFTPVTDSVKWVNNSSIVNIINDSTITCVPELQGTYNYIFSTYSDFGCEFDTTVIIEILPITNSACLNCDSIYFVQPMLDTTICLNGQADLDATVMSNITESEFTYTSGESIITNDQVEAELNVSGIVPGSLTASSIIEVCIDISHQFPSDLEIFLVAPTGQIMELTTNNGGFSSNPNTYENTCFSSTAGQLINFATPPFNGTYLPEGNFNLLNGANINGTWKLQVLDGATGTIDGILNNWSITFNQTHTISYFWTPTTGLSCSNCPNPTASPTTTTEYIVNMSDNFGCAKADTVTVNVIQPLAAPTVACDTLTGTSIQITWAAITGATGYQVNVNNTGWVTTNGVLSHEVTNLVPSQTVNFQVRALQGNVCDGNNGIGITSCTTLPCNQVILVDSTQIVSCFNGNDGIAYLSTTGSFGGATYTLNSSSNTTGIFTGLSADNYTVFVTDVNNCLDSLDFVITEIDSMSFAPTITNNICFDESNGSINLAVTGGTAPYTYAWQGSSETSDTLSNLAIGNYTVTVTDANNCSKTVTYTITEPTDINLSTSKTDALCFGSSDGTATVLSTGGTGAYNYSWDTAPIQTSLTATGLSIGTYQVIVSDIHNCLDSAIVVINQPTPLVTSMDSTDASCFGLNDGTATVNVTGGTGSKTYNWSTTPPQSSATAINLIAGMYSVIVTDSNSCQITDTVIINQPTDVQLSSSINQVTCFGLSDGDVTIVSSGGVGGATYNLNGNSNTTGIFTGLSANSYSVFVTNSNSCLDSIDFIITQPDTMTFVPTIINNICFDESNGSVSVAVTGGTTPYTYAWQASSETSDTLSNLAIGNYTVTVTDANNCSKTATYSITEPTDINLSTSKTDALCFGSSDGTATVLSTGGTGTYNYSWNTTPIQTTLMATGLSMGTYQVVVSDIHNCLDSAIVVVNQPALLVASMDSTNVSCFGFNDGTATVNVTGGTGNRTYNWSTTPPQDSVTAVNLVPGTYFVTVTDAHICQVIDTVVISQPTEIQLSFSTSQVTCFGLSDGDATVVATGGVGSIYTYAWNTTPTQNLPTALNIPGGLFEVTVTDSTNCSISDTVSVYAPVVLDLDVLSSTPTSCYAGNNGTVNIQTSGGTGGKTYVWSTNPFSNGANQTGLVTGQYTVTATDQQGCQLIDSIIVQQPDSIQAMFVTDSVSCFGGNDGTATVSVIGGTTNYTYAWANGQTTAQATGLMTGFAVVTITDANLCILIDSVFVLEPIPITTSFTTTQVSCNGNLDGTATVTPLGGTATYSYLWSNTQTTQTATGLSGGFTIVTVTDWNSCTHIDSVSVLEEPTLTTTDTSFQISCFGANNGTAIALPLGGTGIYNYQWQSIISTNDTITNLAGGMYYYTVTDSDNCTVSDSVFVLEPTPLATAMSSKAVTCFGDIDGEAYVTPSGGTAPYFYTWNNSLQNTDTVYSLSPGFIAVTVTDVYNCQIVDSVLVDEPTPVTSGIISTPTFCNGSADGTAMVIASGGVGNYTYNWVGQGQDSIVGIGLEAGIYFVEVTDSNNCTYIDTAIIIEPTPLGITSNAQNVSCFGQANGAISVTTVGGVGGYMYAWSTTGMNTTSSVTGLIAGTYTVTITDANSCILIDSFVITQPIPMTFTSGSTPVSCSSGSDGSAFINVSGGTMPYNYNWNPVNTNSDSIINLPYGDYAVTVTDALNCIVSDTILVDEPTPIDLTLSQQPSSCNGVLDGEAYVSILGGIPNYSILWDNTPNGVTDSIAYLIGDRYYRVTITDDNGCIAIDSVFVIEPSVISAQVIITDETCFESEDGTATAVITGGTAPFTYDWGANANNQTTQTATNLSAGVYNVLVSDVNNCNTDAIGVVNEPDSLELRLMQQNIDCFGDEAGSASAIAIGGSPSYTFAWQTNTGTQTGKLATNLNVGIHTVAVTDSNGCITNDTVTITEPNAPISAIVNTQDVDCFGDEDGLIELLTTGGTAPYEYSLDGVDYTTSNVLIGLDAADYNITIRDANDCILDETATIIEPDEIIVELGSEIVVEYGETVDLNAQVTNGTQPLVYVWEPADSTLSCADCPNPTVSNIPFYVRYDLIITDANGCTGEDFVILRTKKTRNVFVANGFTPNGDGNNDALFVQGDLQVGAVNSFRVYDRWGELVFESLNNAPNDATLGWNGTFKGQNSNPGIYIWSAEIEFADGEVKIYQGDVLLIR